MNILHICPPHLSDVATLPAENPKSILNIIHTLLTTNLEMLPH